MATKTSLLGLTKPAYTDAADIAVLNTNFDLIDRAVGQGRYVRNELDNSDFMPGRLVNQRGVTSTTTNSVYFADRWMVDSPNNEGSVRVGSDGITLEPTSANGCGIYQRSEHYAEMKGKTYTAAICVNGTWECKTFTMGGLDGGVRFDNGIMLFSVDGMHVLFRAYAAYAPSVTIQRVALYEGAYTADTLPAYVYKGYAAELAECQRYYHLYATEAARPAHGLDCAPPMRLDAPTQGTISINGVTYYYNSADL